MGMLSTGVSSQRESLERIGVRPTCLHYTQFRGKVAMSSQRCYAKSLEKIDSLFAAIFVDRCIATNQDCA